MSRKPLTMGIIGTYNKENEKRLPIHPSHLPVIDLDLRRRIYIEEGYGAHFHAERSYLEQHCAGVMSREQLFETCDIILLPKPTAGDFKSFREGQILWGWPHCVQGHEITQVGIDKKMTYIAWEEMHLYSQSGTWELHVFHKNNELAGYCSTLHALNLMGWTGHYGPRRTAAILSFGATARGAIYALQGMGIHDITVLSRRPFNAVQLQIPTCSYRRFWQEGDMLLVHEDFGRTLAMADDLGKYDVIVNCILQDPLNPVNFIGSDQLHKLRPECLVVDVSCDEKMGFDFAKPTSFETPMFRVGHVNYYAVDHSPSYLWDASTFEISHALIPHISTVMNGPKAWKQCPTINKAIEIREGVVQNPRILKFQNRGEAYPHPVK